MFPDQTCWGLTSSGGQRSPQHCRAEVPPGLGDNEVREDAGLMALWPAGRQSQPKVTIAQQRQSKVRTPPSEPSVAETVQIAHGMLGVC